MRRCDESDCEILCMTCNNQSNENKNLAANLNFLKRKALNQFGQMLPCHTLSVIIKNYRIHLDVPNYLCQIIIILLKRISVSKKSSLLNEWYTE